MIMHSSELKFFGLKQSRFELSGLLKNSKGIVSMKVFVDQKK
jgi:hypothetical protein